MRSLDTNASSGAWVVAGIALAGLVVFLFSGPAATADSTDGGAFTEEAARKVHAEVDTNGDGAVDRNEYYRRMVDIFYLNDVDKDGHLNREELIAMQEGMVFAPADRNNDGKLTMPEYIDQRFEAFHEGDDDSNGLISVEEVIEIYTTP